MSARSWPFWSRWHQARGDRVAVGSRKLEHFAQTAKKTEHAPRGRDTSRNSLVPLGASESPRSALSPAVSVPRYHAPTTRAWRAGSLARKWSQATSNDRLGFLAVPRLWGLPDSPQAQAVGFPTHTHRYSESPYGSSPLGSLLRSVRPPGTDFETTSNPSIGSNPLDQHICPSTCASVATERVTRSQAPARLGTLRAPPTDSPPHLSEDASDLRRASDTSSGSR